MSDEYGYTKDQTREMFDEWYRSIGADDELIERLWQDLQEHRRAMKAFAGE
jgi:hypothetical protein